MKGGALINFIAAAAILSLLAVVLIQFAEFLRYL